MQIRDDQRYRIISRMEIADKNIVLYDYMDFPKDEQAKNLRAYNEKGDIIWIAEHPTKAINDCYTEIKVNDEKTLVAYNFACYICIINIKNGRLINYEFTK